MSHFKYIYQALISFPSLERVSGISDLVISKVSLRNWCALKNKEIS